MQNWTIMKMNQIVDSTLVEPAHPSSRSTLKPYLQYDKNRAKSEYFEITSYFFLFLKMH